MELSSVELAAREHFLVTHLAALASALLLVPGHPENGPFFLVKGLINAVQSYRWCVPVPFPSSPARSSAERELTCRGCPLIAPGTTLARTR